MGGGSIAAVIGEYDNDMTYKPQHQSLRCQSVTTDMGPTPVYDHDITYNRERRECLSVTVAITHIGATRITSISLLNFTCFFFSPVSIAADI